MFDKIKYDSMLVLISYLSRLHSGTVLAQITEILFKNKIDFEVIRFIWKNVGKNHNRSEKIMFSKELFSSLQQIQGGTMVAHVPRTSVDKKPKFGGSWIQFWTRVSNKRHTG